MTGDPGDHIAEAARREAERERLGRETPEPSLASRLGQIGVLGWMVVLPMLVGVLLGRMADRHFGTGIFFSAPGVMLGAAIGFRSAWKWMHRQ